MANDQKGLAFLIMFFASATAGSGIQGIYGSDHAFLTIGSFWLLIGLALLLHAELNSGHK